MKALMIEDDQEIVEFVSLAFKVGSPEVELLSTNIGEEGIELVEKESPDIVILDLGLPDIDGFEVLKQIRLFSTVPIIILTVRGEEPDIVRGLEWGADEYVVKPFGQMELLARVKTLLKRQHSTTEEPPFYHGPICFYPSTGQLIMAGEDVSLTRTESLILQHLIRNTGRVVTHSSLAETLWGEDYPGSTDAIRVYIRRLRGKLETDPGRPQLILTKAGVGYSITKPS